MRRNKRLTVTVEETTIMSEVVTSICHYRSFHSILIPYTSHIATPIQHHNQHPTFPFNNNTSQTSSAIPIAIQPSQNATKEKRTEKKKEKRKKKKNSQSCPELSAPSSPSTPSTKLKPTGSPPAGTVVKDFVITGTCVSNPHATSTSVLRVLRTRPVGRGEVVVMVMGIGIVMVKVGGGKVVVGVVGDGIERKLKRRGFVMREFRGGCD